MGSVCYHGLPSYIIKVVNRIINGNFCGENSNINAHFFWKDINSIHLLMFLKNWFPMKLRNYWKSDVILIIKFSAFILTKYFQFLDRNTRVIFEITKQSRKKMVLKDTCFHQSIGETSISHFNILNFFESLGVTNLLKFIPTHQPSN